MTGRMPPLRLETITTSERLVSLRPHWSNLWESCPNATPFQSPEWLLPWWEQLGRGRLFTLAVWHHDQLVGLAPLFAERYFGLPVRRLALIGTGNTDYLDLLLAPETASAALSLILDAIAAEPKRWDFCDFQQLRLNSHLLAEDLALPLQRRVLEQEVCPVLSLPAGPNPLEAVLPTRLRSNLRYYGRRIEREGGSLGIADPEGLTDAMDALFQLHETRWRRRKLPGVFTNPRVRRFHLLVARGFAERGWLRLHTLSFEKEIKAALYCFHCRGRAYYYAGGFDPTLARLSPGTVLTGRAVHAAADEGVQEFDFLRGDESYKYTWSATNRTNHRVLCWRMGTPGALAPRLVALEQRIEHLAKGFARRLQERYRSA